MVTVLAGAVAWPAAAMLNGIADFPRRNDATLPIILAQSTGGGDGNYGNNTDSAQRADPPVPPPPPGVSADAIGITPKATKAIVDAIRQGAAFCELIRDKRLNIDCLSDQYRYIAQQLPGDGGYSGVRDALFSAALKLHQLAVDHYDGTAKTKPSKGGHTAHRYLVPVKNPDRFNAQAVAIVDEAATVLLRSSSGSDQRRIAYEEVAAVVDSNKVLLRSA